MTIPEIMMTFVIALFLGVMLYCVYTIKVDDKPQKTSAQ